MARKSGSFATPGQEQLPVQPVDRPILCNPYEEPRDHWIYDKETGAASRAGTRRQASYWYKTERTGSAQLTLTGLAEEERDDLPLVNALREDVRKWREAGYPGATNVTCDLLRHWARPDRARRLFFCQVEAVETIVYLLEIRFPGKVGIRGNPKLSKEDLKRLLAGERPSFSNPSQDFFPRLIDPGQDASLAALRRIACKMATGSGKTVVMSMVVAWAFCNRGQNPATTLFPNGVLICCPNLTVKERLQVLRPERPDNYYEAFDIVPLKYRSLLQSGKVLVTNWHRFAPESEHSENGKSYAVVNKGPETPDTFARRVLEDLYDRLPIMVMNDEGHHCWRPAPAAAASPAGMMARAALIASRPKQPLQVAAEDRTGVLGADSQLQQRSGLSFENAGVPAARKKRRVGTEKQAAGAGDIQRPGEHGLQVQTVVPHPVVGAGGVQVHVGALVRQHEGLAEIAGPEMRNDERQFGVTQGDGVQIDGVGEAHVERRRQTELLPNAHGEDAAVDEHGAAGHAGGFLEDRPHALVLHRVAVHGREEADGAQTACQGGTHAPAGVLLQRIEHEVAEEPVRAGGHRRRHRGFVAGHAGDQRGLCHGVGVQFPHPGASQVRGILGRRLPTQERGRLGYGLAALGGQRSQEPVREEMDVGVRDGEIAPRGLHRAYSFASGLFQCVRPAARASCVRPATLFTPSFFIMVLR